MRRRLERLSVPAPRAIIGSLVAAAAAQIALVGTGVITARALGPTDRGYLALVILVPTVIGLAGTLGLPRAVTFFLASDRESEASVRRVMRMPVIVQALALTLVAVAVLAALVANEPAEVTWAGVAMVPLLAANLAETYGKAILQGQRRYLYFNVLRNVMLFAYLAILLGLLAVDVVGLLEFAIAWVLANVFSGVLTLGIALAPKPPAGTPVALRELARFGLRGYVASLSPIGTFRLDQLLVGVALAPQALGLYVVGLAFTNLPMFISRSIGFVAYPHVAHASDQRRDEMRRFFWLYIALSGAAVIGLEVLAGRLIPFFFGSEFDDAVPLTRILLVGAFFAGARALLAETSSGEGRPGLGSISEVVSWIALVPALAILLPLWGVEGVAIANAIASIASFLALLLLVRRPPAGLSS
jgi:O-antigen/teichoic acid export membrane protein